MNVSFGTVNRVSCQVLQAKLKLKCRNKKKESISTQRFKALIFFPEIGV